MGGVSGKVGGFVEEYGGLEPSSFIFHWGSCRAGDVIRRMLSRFIAAQNGTEQAFIDVYNSSQLFNL